MTCVHCGFCLSACPTYLETGSEADSPRGRIVLMRGLHEGTLATTDADVRRHLDLCLGCRACESACPSGVPYGNLLETVREQINNDGVRSPGPALARQVLLGTLSSPGKMTVAMRVAKLMPGGANPSMAVKLLSGDRAATGQALALPERIAPPLPPGVTSAVGKRRFRVGMLTGCVMRVLYGETNNDTVRVLAANGCEVLVNQLQACCGALHLHNGYGQDARNMARGLIDAFWPWHGLDAIIVNSAGCGSTLKEYGHLLSEDTAYAAKAIEFAALIKDVSEFLDEAGWVAPFREAAASRTIAYHDACHLAHGQQIREAPRLLLEKIPGTTLVPLGESEICCGSAGIYNLTEPAMAKRLQDRKIRNILETGATVIATGNPGCLSWIQSGLAVHGHPNIRVAHPITLLAEALC